MAFLTKLKGFTLIESLVAGIIISIVTGLSMVIYLNVASSMSSTKDIIIASESYHQLDSLARVKGEHRDSYALEDDLQVVFSKETIDGDTDLYQLELEVLDSSGITQVHLMKIVYE